MRWDGMGKMSETIIVSSRADLVSHHWYASSDGTLLDRLGDERGKVKGKYRRRIYIALYYKLLISKAPACNKVSWHHRSGRLWTSALSSGAVCRDRRSHTGGFYKQLYRKLYQVI